MSDSSAVRTIVVPWRKICGALPAVALMSAGIAFAAPVSPAQDFSGVAVSSNSPAIVVPDTALTMQAFRDPDWTDPFTAPPQAPGLVPPGGSGPTAASSDGAVFGSSASVALDSTGVPVRALEAYRAAALVVDAADPACHVDWALLAAFGRVESNHARFGGNQLDAAGVAQPGIIGIPLDGTNGTARIIDSDGGQLDRDTIYDRAVGPMQFIPSTWRAMGVDADGDGVKNPQDMADSATATAVYVCSGSGDLSQPSDLHAAIMRYNPSDSYARTVTAIAAEYRLGVRALPDTDPPAAVSAPSTFFVTKAAPIPAPSTRAAHTRAASKTAGKTATQTPTAQTPAAPRPAAPAPEAQGPAAPSPAAPAPEAQGPAAPSPAAPAPAAPAPAPPDTTLPVPCLPVPTPTDPLPTDAVPTDPLFTDPVPTDPLPTDPLPTDACLPNPCLPDPTPTTPDTVSPTPGTLETCTMVPLDPAPTTP